MGRGRGETLPLCCCCPMLLCCCILPPNCYLLLVQIQKGNGVKYTPGHGPPVPQHCPETGSGFAIGGPFWAEPIHDMDAVASIMQLIKEQRDRQVKVTL